MSLITRRCFHITGVVFNFAIELSNSIFLMFCLHWRMCETLLSIFSESSEVLPLERDRISPFTSHSSSFYSAYVLPINEVRFPATLTPLFQINSRSQPSPSPSAAYQASAVSVTFATTFWAHLEKTSPSNGVTFFAKDAVVPSQAAPRIF